MAFWGGLANKVQRAYIEIKNNLVNAYAARDVKSSDIQMGQGGLKFAIQTNTSQARGTSEAVIKVWLDRQVQQEIQQQIGEIGVSVVKDILEPIKRTGTVAGSFRYKIDSGDNSVLIFSDHPAAASIQSGIKKAGSTQDLVSWLHTKPEHSGKTEAELKRLAFNIRRKIDRGDSPGPNSTLKTLAPQGERRFDYIGEATKEIEKELNEVFNSFII